MTRTLVLLQHAKTESGEGRADRDRELTDRGRRDAAAAGDLLAERFPDAIDLVYCSTATRTRQTWQEVADAGVEAGEVRDEAAVYNADPEDLLDLLRDETPDEAASVLIVGHAPGVPMLLALLADDDLVDSGVDVPAPDDYGTAGLAVLEFDGDWDEVAEHSMRVRSYDRPRG